MNRRTLIYLAPVGVFGLVAVAFLIALGIDPNILPSALINKEVPDFSLPPLPGKGDGFSSADLKGHVSVVNAFASWCGPCRLEQPALNALARKKRVAIYGIDYKDPPEAGLAWLGQFGDPYTKIGRDSGQVGLDWGIYGVPETFLIDKTGRIRYKHVGPLTQDVIDNTLLPLVAQLEK
jgi:cytochrome c biogenesis protein CcmG/thiol:disulfide interchange protein DsbE